MRRAINHLKDSDPVLAAIIGQVGRFRREYDEPTFHNLARCIVYQQLHGRAAATIFGRLEALAGRPLTPDAVLRASEQAMRAAGLSKQKLSYLRDLASKTHDQIIVFSRLAEMSDLEVIQHLTQVKGIGVWTAHMFLMFALRRPDVLPIGDLGIRLAIQKHYRKRKLPNPQQMERIAKSWQPYRSVACWYLWRSLDGKKL
jgi:DNA-3-methyladenine glycosylase II